MKKNMRWVVTIVKLGFRTLFRACQGRYTHATKEEAETELNAFLDGGHLPKVYTPEAIASMRVDQIECWPDHNDPKGIYIHEE